MDQYKHKNYMPSFPPEFNDDDLLTKFKRDGSMPSKSPNGFIIYRKWVAMDIKNRNLPIKAVQFDTAKMSRYTDLNLPQISPQILVDTESEPFQSSNNYNQQFVLNTVSDSNKLDNLLQKVMTAKKTDILEKRVTELEGKM
ncbi:4466_t:CDS:2, partial [Ambispora gerdemannii]